MITSAHPFKDLVAWLLIGALSGPLTPSLSAASSSGLSQALIREETPPHGGTPHTRSHHHGLLAIPNHTTGARVSARYGQLPLTFEANQGQADSRVKFLARGNGYNLFLTPTEAMLTLRRTDEPGTMHDELPARHSAVSALRMQLVGAHPAPPITGLDELPGKSHYFIGDDPTKWRTDIATYAKVRYSNVYPGVDLIYYGNQRQLEYDLVVGPGVDPGVIKIKLEGLDTLRLDAQGDLVLWSRGGEMRLHKPVVYQPAESGRREIAGRYVLDGQQQVSFAIAAYDRTKPLVIDPVLVYSTYLGGSAAESFPGIAVDAAGDVYFASDTASVLDFPTVNPIQPAQNGGNFAVVSKLNATGTALIYSTYLGGTNNFTFVSAQKGSGGIAIDGSGNVYVAGFTNANNFPTTANAFQRTFAGGSDPFANYDVFLTKINAAGNALLYSTYLGGSDAEATHSVAADNNGNAWVTGATFSTNFPTKNAFQPQNAGKGDVFVSRFDTTQSGAASLIYSTYFGGSEDDTVGDGPVRGIDTNVAIAIDPSGNAYIAGGTRSRNFPILNAFQPLPGNFPGGTIGFVAKFNGAGALVYSTHLGGGSNDYASGIAVDAAGHAHVTGFAQSTDFPRKNPLHPSRSIGIDGFITKLSTTGSQLIFSTYLAGGGVDGNPIGQSIAVDSAGNVYVVGQTDAANFPTKNPVQATFGGVIDAFVMQLNNTGTELTFSTYLGGSQQDIGTSIAVGTGGSIYVAGRTFSLDFPTVNPFQPNNDGSPDNFITKIGSPLPAPFSITGISPSTGGDAGTVTATIHGSSMSEGATVTLVKTGQPDIAGSPGVVSHLGEFLTTTFGLTGKPRGTYDVLVTNANGASATIPGGFTIVGGGAPRLFVTVAGRSVIRIGNWQNFYVLYGNLGNVDSDASSVPVYISFPRFVTFRPVTNQPFQVGQEGERTLITFTVAMVPASSGGNPLPLPFQLKVADAADAHRLFRVRASIGHPYIASSPSQITSASGTQMSSSVGQVMSPLGPGRLDPVSPLFNRLFSQHEGGETDPRTPNDPNDKAGSIGVGAAHYFTGDIALPYAVYFENVDTASLPAQDVVITDQLNPALVDLSTFSFGLISFGDKLVSPPPGVSQFATDVDLRPDHPIFVRINASLNTITGLLRWEFNSIDPATGQPPGDPLVGFLPPNHNSPEGQGAVVFTVRPKATLASGTQITNQASIVFDVNPPINTPQWVNTIDSAMPSSQVLALPAGQCETFTVQWSGTDAESGVSDYTILVSDNGGPHTPFVVNTAATSAVFTGQPGHSYAFLSVAQDNVGNIEDAPTGGMPAPPPGPVVLSVANVGPPLGTVTSNPAGVNCGTDCSGSYPAGTMVTLTAVARRGLVFAGFSGGGCSGTETYTATLNADTAITATFTAPPDQPVITAPLEDDPAIAPGASLGLSWTPAAGASQHGLEFSGRNLNFGNPGGAGPDPVDGFGGAGGGFPVPGTGTNLAVPPGTPPGAYRVRIIGLSPAFAPVGRFSEAITVLVGGLPGGQPAFTAPAASSALPRGSQATFSWTTVAGAASYLFEFEGGPASGRTGGSLIIVATGFDAVVPREIPPGTYRVRLLGLSATGAPVGTFSATLTFTVQ